MTNSFDFGPSSVDFVTQNGPAVNNIDIDANSPEYAFVFVKALDQQSIQLSKLEIVMKENTKLRFKLKQARDRIAFLKSQSSVLSGEDLLQLSVPTQQKAQFGINQSRYSDINCPLSLNNPPLRGNTADA